MGKSIVKCLLDKAWPLPHEFNSSNGYLNKIRVCQHSRMDKGRTYEATPLAMELMAARGGRAIFPQGCSHW